MPYSYTPKDLYLSSLSFLPEHLGYKLSNTLVYKLNALTVTNSQYIMPYKAHDNMKILEISILLSLNLIFKIYCFKWINVED